MKKFILKNENYLELTSELTALIVEAMHGDRAMITKGDGVLYYTEEAQDDFNDKILDVEEKLRIAMIFGENDECAGNKVETLSTNFSALRDDVAKEIKALSIDNEFIVEMSKYNHEDENVKYRVLDGELAEIQDEEDSEEDISINIHEVCLDDLVFILESVKTQSNIKP